MKDLERYSIQDIALNLEKRQKSKNSTKDTKMLNSVSQEVEWDIVLEAKRENNISVVVTKSKEAYQLKRVEQNSVPHLIIPQRIMT